VKFPCSFWLCRNFVILVIFPKKKSWSCNDRLVHGAALRLPTHNQPYPIQMPFLFSLLFLHYPINSIVSSWKNQIWNFSNWAKCSQLDWDHKNLGLQINRDLPARNQVPTMNRRGLFYVESPYPFLLYVKFTNWIAPAPCLKTHSS